MQRLELESNYGFPALNTAEIAVLVDIASKLGVSSIAALHRTGLSSTALQESPGRVSLQQHLTTLFNVTERSGDRLMPLRAGSRVHLTAFGIVGYALWSSASLGDALELSTMYRPLLNLKCGPTLSFEGSTAVLYFSGPVGLSVAEKEMCTEMEVAKVLTFLNDLQVKGFHPIEVRLTSAAFKQSTGLSVLLGCPVVGHSDVAQIRFDASWLEQRLPQFNPITHRACIRACDELLTAQENTCDLVTRVRTILVEASGNIPTLPEVANTLCMSARTLRRRLDTMETSYSEILNSVRKTLAIHYVSTTQLTTEIIAERLNYSDAANFSHAFKRWTGEAPRQYRARLVGRKADASDTGKSGGLSFAQCSDLRVAAV
ncbi:AraC family transcriptional regulator ligand-binding domain-containing protein [Paraburkholderia sp.]|uniref:AraC family transcriptional regulator n=1 Tax=Paraburkholderia sp. TaxID=1926495 RepID=UPI003C7BA371